MNEAELRATEFGESEALSFEVREMLTMLTRLEDADTAHDTANPFGEGFDF